MSAFDGIFKLILDSIDKEYDRIVPLKKDGVCLTATYVVKKKYNTPDKIANYKRILERAYNKEKATLKTFMHVDGKQAVLCRHKLSSIIASLILNYKPVGFCLTAHADHDEIDMRVLYINYRIAFSACTAFLRKAIISRYRRKLFLSKIYYDSIKTGCNENLALNKVKEAMFNEPEPDYTLIKDAKKLKDSFLLDDSRRKAVFDGVKKLENYPELCYPSTAHEHEFYPEALKQGLNSSELQKYLSRYDEGLIKYLYLNDMGGKEFNHLFFSYIMFALDNHNTRILGIKNHEDFETLMIKQQECPLFAPDLFK